MEDAGVHKTEKEHTQEAAPSMSPEKIKIMDRQSITLLVILVLVLATFIAAYLILKPKPYFEYEQLKIYPVKYAEGMIFYSIPMSFNFGNYIQDSNVVLRNDPRNLANISYSVNSSLFRMIGIGFTMDPSLTSNAVIAAQEISKFAETLRLPTAFAVTQDPEGKVNAVLNCENATNLTRIVRVEIGNETRVYGNANCIIVEGEDYDRLIKASDKLTFEWLKTMTKHETA